jgi:hypothetical protein
MYTFPKRRDESDIILIRPGIQPTTQNIARHQVTSGGTHIFKAKPSGY